VLLNEEVAPELRAKAARCLASMLKDRAARPVLEVYGEPPLCWFASRETAERAGIDVVGRDITTPRPLPEGNVLYGMMSEKSGAVWLSAEQKVDRIGHTLAHELGHLARAAYDADPVTQRAVKGWHKADTNEHEQSAKAMERLLRRHQYA
jgi:Zn-dependent peptidase ImmA (M78 family)